MKRLAAALLFCAAACGPSEPDCGRLLDHFLDVEARDATRGFSGLTDRMSQALTDEQRALRGAIEQEFVGKCRRQLSASEVRCALEAEDPESMDRCDQQR